MADTIKLTLSALILALGIGAFYFFGEQALPLRVLYVLLAVGAAVAVAVKTAKGAEGVEFVRGATVEIRKVVWPTRKEITQTTLVVVAMVVVVGIILWLFDVLLGWGVSMLTGHSGG